MVRYQLPVLAAALLLGVAHGRAIGSADGWLAVLIWPSLAALLYTTFCEVRSGEVASALKDRRFLTASLFGNFAAVPLLIALIGGLLPLDPAVRLGIYMVLLVPCTDWFMTFARLGRGNAELAMAVTPLLLLVQVALLPIYLWLFLGREFTDAVRLAPFLTAFATLIALPFLLALLTRTWAGRHATRTSWLRLTSKLTVPLLGLVIFLVAASQAQTVLDRLDELTWVPLLFTGYLVLAALLAGLLAPRFRLDAESGRTLAFNLGTRNSFVVLPMALSLPQGWDLAVAVIVLQSLVELAGMIAYLWLVPGWLFRR